MWSSASVVTIHDVHDEFPSFEVSAERISQGKLAAIVSIYISIIATTVDRPRADWLRYFVG